MPKHRAILLILRICALYGPIKVNFDLTQRQEILVGHAKSPHLKKRNDGTHPLKCLDQTGFGLSGSKIKTGNSASMRRLRDTPSIGSTRVIETVCIFRLFGKLRTHAEECCKAKLPSHYPCLQPQWMGVREHAVAMACLRLCALAGPCLRLQALIKPVPNEHI